MKKIIIAILIVGFLSSCKKEEITPKPTVYGVWQDNNSVVTIYNDSAVWVYPTSRTKHQFRLVDDKYLVFHNTNYSYELTEKRFIFGTFILVR